MEFNRGALLIFLLFFILFTPTGTPPRILTSRERAQLEDFLKTRNSEFDILTNATLNHGFLNMTGIGKYPGEYSPRRSFFPSIIFDEAEKLWTLEKALNDGDSDEAIKKLEDIMEIQSFAQGMHSGIDTEDDLDPQVEASVDAFREDDRYLKIEKEVSRHNARSLDTTIPEMAYYRNISGVFKGGWSKLDAEILPIDMPIPVNDSLLLDDVFNMTRYNSYEYALMQSEGRMIGNVSEDSGKFQVSLHELSNSKPDYNVSLLEMELSLFDTEEAHTHNIALRGLHFKDTGNIVLTTSSLKFSGEFALPYFDISDESFEESKALMLRYLNRTLISEEENYDYGIYDEAFGLAQQCEYVIFGHVHSAPLNRQDLQDIEDELHDPIGRPHKPIPPLNLQAMFYSPDCGIALTTNGAVGKKFEQYWNSIRNLALAGCVLILWQTVQMALQMKETSTPSTISKVSFYSIGLMSIIDGGICMASLVSSFIDAVALPFVAVAFLAFALTSMFEMRYLVKIYQAQLPESVADARARAAAFNGQVQFVARPDGSIVPGGSNSASPAPNASATAESLPIAASPPTINTPINDTTSLLDQDERQIAGMIYSRFYFTLLVFIILSLSAASWPIWYRRVYEYAALLTMYSLWLPQIYRNVSRGSRKSFTWKFIINTTVIRVIPVLYLCLIPKNVVEHHYDPIMAAVICGWLWVQICILVAQNVFGPRFFLPKGYLPTVYDYHPIITEEDLESGFNIEGPDSNVSASHDLQDPSQQPLLSEMRPELAIKSHPKVDCAICMNAVELVVIPKGGASIASNPANILARRHYMVTPCRHVFHTECMERWMRTRLQCPVCRNPLPPV